MQYTGTQGDGGPGQKKGLDGIAITEHDHLWSKKEIQNLIQSTRSDPLVILRGKEIVTSLGHVLLYNYYEEILRNDSLETLTEKVRNAGRAAVLAHPFRYGHKLKDSPDKIKRLFSLFDAVEILTPNHSEEEIRKGFQWFKAWGLAAVGSSDSHDSRSMGAYLTSFPKLIQTESDLVQAIRDHQCRPIRPIGSEIH